MEKSYGSMESLISEISGRLDIISSDFMLGVVRAIQTTGV
jgi:hypothetical protein